MQAVCYIQRLGIQSFNSVTRGGLTWLECAAFRRLPWIVHAFSTRRGGVSRTPANGLNLGFTGWDERPRVERNRQIFFEQLHVPDFALASLRQIHSSHTYKVMRDAEGRPDFLPGGFALVEPSNERMPVGDGLMTQEVGILLPVKVADCLPVLLVDPRRRAVCALHSGWRGALARIIEKGVGEMRRIFGSAPHELQVALGPSIRACCYRVGEEVVEVFEGRFRHAERFFRRCASPSEDIAEHYPVLFLSSYPPGHEPSTTPAAHLDLVAVAEDQLRTAGVDPRHIYVSEFCTACRTDLFFSYRKEGARTGRLMGVIGIRPEGTQ